jgi:putative membrane protein
MDEGLYWHLGKPPAIPGDTYFLHIFSKGGNEMETSFFTNFLTQWRGYGWGHGPGMGWGFGMGWFGLIIMALFWILIIVAIIFLIRWLMISSRMRSLGQKPEETALEILKKRYARGEIKKEEFEEKKRDLV